MNQSSPSVADIPASTLAILRGQPSMEPTEVERAALGRLIAVARANSGQSVRVANFLLAWWNAGTCGSFDMTELWSVDDDLVADMVTVFALIARVRVHPDALGYEDDFVAIVQSWRPELS